MKTDIFYLNLNSYDVNNASMVISKNNEFIPNNDYIKLNYKSMLEIVLNFTNP